METILIIKDLLQQLSNINVLDLGAGKGFYSLFCASYGANVVAVDNNQNKLNIFPNYLINHPKIKFFENNIQNFLIEHKNKYNLILIINVIPFLEKNYIKFELFNYLSNLLVSNGYLLFTFFLPNDETMFGKVNTYKMDDFNYLKKKFKISKKSNYKLQEDHKPIGKHCHHIGYYLLKTNNK